MVARLPQAWSGAPVERIGVAKRKRRRKAKIKPPLGPAVNLRPAGAHEDKRRYDRKGNKAIIETEAEAADQE